MQALRLAARRAAGEALLECSTSGRQPGALAQACRAFSAAAAELAPGSITLTAELRGSVGSIAANKLRKGGKTPGIVFSGPGEEQQLLAFDSTSLSKLVGKLGRTAWACTIFDLQVQRDDGSSATLRALGRQVHMTADTDAVENVTFIYCPPERQVRVEVPLKVIGDDVCPGIKAGGRVNWIRRTIPCVARGDAIPKDFTVDISKMAMNDKLSFHALQLPEGVTLHKVNPALPILKVAK
ncbi:50S ribosomal L25 [Chlorella sorokiniana]|uniref:50S ribosomal L25 n=1 Tax=Chlorella sorokiniana TaxID=3076 RepID=A0A2P6TZB5_CHLSO|nr:50S ribosomal L25 [Chlorella sorokiniana]|eukprot:PRW59407.1 50S ribosomal L25 [Chlorella sorokiniana]